MRALVLLISLGFLSVFYLSPAGAQEEAKVLGYLRIDNLAPSEIGEQTICSIVAALKYDVPANVILAIAEIENGKPGGKVLNSNGTYDIGVMQFNTSYLSTLLKYGITSEDVSACGCYPYELAAWRIRGHLLNDAGDLWQRAANYHSKTPKYNTLYRAKLIPAAARWARWLDERFPTRDVLYRK